MRYFVYKLHETPVAMTAGCIYMNSLQFPWFVDSTGYMQ